MHESYHNQIRMVNFSKSKECLQCRPNTNGWLLTGVIAVLDAALMCAKSTRVSVLAHIERKFMSFIGGCTVLYIAGRRPSFCVPSLDSPCCSQSLEAEFGSCTIDWSYSVAPFKVRTRGSVPCNAKAVDIKQHVSSLHIVLLCSGMIVSQQLRGIS